MIHPIVHLSIYPTSDPSIHLFYDLLLSKGPKFAPSPATRFIPVREESTFAATAGKQPFVKKIYKFRNGLNAKAWNFLF
jgi:hypothetical protein